MKSYTEVKASMPLRSSDIRETKKEIKNIIKEGALCTRLELKKSQSFFTPAIIEITFLIPTTNKKAWKQWHETVFGPFPKEKR